jgi:hypothetical protein
MLIIDTPWLAGHSFVARAWCRRLRTEAGAAAQRALPTALHPA